MSETDPKATVQRGEDPPGVRIFLRALLGIFGGLFLGTVAVVALWSSTESRPTPDGLVFVVVSLVGAFSVGSAVFARNRWFRVLAWAIGGAGFGDLLLAVLVGGLSVGDFLTPMGIVLALVGANRLNLRYCVSNAFAENKGKVVAWVQGAAAAWETLGKVKFIYVPSEDGNATSANNNVTFDVRPASQSEETNNPYGIVARTFFPSSERTAREFVIYRSFLTMDPGYLFKHELGHALGFRHEHVWFGNWTGERPVDVEALTPHDTASIMYYFFLPGYDGNKDFSAHDREGASKVYSR